MRFDVRKETGGKYYIVNTAFPNEPLKGSFGEKKKVMKNAAKMNGISYKEFLKYRKEN